jgi:hypothetical protein
MTGHRAVTPDHVQVALAVLGLPATGAFPATEWHLPMLLGALLRTAETEIAGQCGDPDRRHRVVDGYLAQPCPDLDPFHPLSLAVLRLNLTSAELDRLQTDLTHPKWQRLRAELVALDADITAIVKRFETLVTDLHQLTQAR